MFCYLMSEGPESFDFQSAKFPDGNTFVFPSERHNKQDDMAGKVTSVLKSISKKGTVVGLTEKHTSQGLKHGAADDCCLNPNNSLVSTVSRANWDYSGEVRTTNFCFPTLPECHTNNISFSTIFV